MWVIEHYLLQYVLVCSINLFHQKAIFQEAMNFIHSDAFHDKDDICIDQYKTLAKQKVGWAPPTEMSADIHDTTPDFNKILPK